MVSLIKKRAILWLSIAIFAFIFAGCSSSDGSNEVPLAAPTDMGLDARSGVLTVQFSRIDGIGAGGTTKYPSFEVFISTLEDGSDIDLDDPWLVPAPESRLVQFSIVKSKPSTVTMPTFEYDTLTDGEKYWIFVRTDFAKSGYGKSEFAKIQAVPIPMPSAIEDFDVQVGDQRIVATWKEKPYEEYAVHIDDCPKNYTQTRKTGNWTPAGATAGNNRIFAVDNNTAGHRICIVATNVNGKGDWDIWGTIDDDTSTIMYTNVIAEDAVSTPAEPDVTIVKNANKRVDFSFPAVVIGERSASDYQYSYKPAGGSWSTWESVLITSLADYDAATGIGTASASIANLVNGTTYDIKMRAVNAQSTGVEGTIVEGNPVYTELNFNNPDEYLSKANSAFIYAEDVPHSDFWRIGDYNNAGGRPNTDRLVRGKETALGNLFADAVQWYAEEKGYNTDFAWLMGDMISTGIQSKQTITPKFLQSIVSSDYLDDTLVIVTVKGSKLISQLDYDLDLDNYPMTNGKFNNGYAVTLFGQAAAANRNGHYGGGGTLTYSGKIWGIPSSEVRYTIQYKDYDLNELTKRFTTGNAETIQGCVEALAANNGAYDYKTDSLGCYLIQDYREIDNSSKSEYKWGYTRGKIKTGTLTINGSDVVPTQDYRIITTKKLADSEYSAFLGVKADNKGVTLVRAVAEYIYNNGSAGIDPYLDGRVRIEGGVPGDSRNDFVHP